MAVMFLQDIMHNTQVWHQLPQHHSRIILLVSF